MIEVLFWAFGKHRKPRKERERRHLLTETDHKTQIDQSEGKELDGTLLIAVRDTEVKEVPLHTLDTSHADRSTSLQALVVKSHHDTAGTYQYKELIDTEVRLLKIEHASGNSSPLKATLEHVPLLSAREMGYTALSYTWGDLRNERPCS
jgi:hypothetical protein